MTSSPASASSSSSFNSNSNQGHKAFSDFNSVKLSDYSSTEKAISEIFGLGVACEVEVIKEHIPEGYLVKENFYLTDGSVLVHISFYSILLPYLPSLSWVMFVKEDEDEDLDSNKNIDSNSYFPEPLIGNTLEDIERQLSVRWN